MQVRALRPFYGKEGQVKRGATIEVTERRARDLLVAQLVELIGESGAVTPVPAHWTPDAKADRKPLAVTKRATRGGDRAAAAIPPQEPPPASPAGGPTGEARPSSSSAPARPPRRRRLSTRGAGPD